MLGDSLYLENIQAYVQDEEKIVTYKWLSRKLDVPVNAAKQMLYAYARQSKDTDPINVTYVVSGIIRSRSGGNTHHEVCIVNESNLEDAKQRFGELFSIHVYSVQKAYLKDSGMLFGADYEVTKGYIGDYSKWSTIDCPVSTRLSIKRTQVSEIPAKISVAKLPKLSHHVKQEALQQSTSMDTNSKVDANKNPSKGKLKVQHGRGTVASLFARQSQNGQRGMTNSKVKLEPYSNSGKDTTKTNIVQLVSPKKSQKSPAKRGRPTRNTEPPSKKLTGMFKVYAVGDSDIEEFESGEEPSRKKVSTTRQTKDEKEIAGITCGEAQLHRRGDPQKRKRVQELSSDEEELEEHRVQKMKTEHVSHKVKKRKRYKKMVTKMFTNDEGEMVTERVCEVVSTDASADEEEKPVITQAHNKTEKLSPPKQTKQVSLTSFFRR